MAGRPNYEPKRSPSMPGSQGLRRGYVSENALGLRQGPTRAHFGLRQGLRQQRIVWPAPAPENVRKKHKEIYKTHKKKQTGPTQENIRKTDRAGKLTDTHGPNIGLRRAYARV